MKTQSTLGEMIFTLYLAIQGMMFFIGFVDGSVTADMRYENMAQSRNLMTSFLFMYPVGKGLGIFLFKH